MARPGSKLKNFMAGSIITLQMKHFLCLSSFQALVQLY